MSELVEGDPFDPLEDATRNDNARKIVDDKADETRRALERRQLAYRRVFGTADPADVAVVLEDLKAFCRGDNTPWHENERYHCLLTGRHEVYTRIVNHTKLSLDELLQKLS